MTLDRLKTVTQCVCHKRTFEEIIAVIREEKIDDFEEALALDIFGQGCRMCHPYVKKAIKTGEVAFRPGDVDFE